MALRTLTLKIAMAAALLGVASPAGAGPAVSLITNGSFETTSLSTKGVFQNNVAGWTGGAKLTYLNFPGTATTIYLAVYSGFPATSPDQGNFVEGDGDPNYSSAISQVVNGLYVGNRYRLSFYQAAGQQAGFKGPTTEQWKVTFGNDTQYSTKFFLAEGATGLWQSQTMTFVASAVSQTLSFLAAGTPSGAPPISFLDGVSLIDVPEPASLALLGAGLTGLLGIRARRQARA